MTESLSKKIEDALENLVTLEIMTAVGKVQFKSENGQDANFPNLDPNEDSKVILTKINLLQGDITNVIDPAFVTGDYQSLRDFHTETQKEGSAIINNNLAALKELYNLAKSWKK